MFGAPALAGATSPVYVALLTAILGFGIATGDSALRLANALGSSRLRLPIWYLGETVVLALPRRVALVIVTLGSGWSFYLI